VDSVSKAHRSLTSDDIAMLDCDELEAWIKTRDDQSRNQLIIALPAVFEQVNAELAALRTEYAARCRSVDEGGGT